MSGGADDTSKYKEQFAKKKFHGFLADLLRFGSTKGFRYFGMYLRGREEIVLRVQNEQTCSGRHLLSKCDSYGVEDEEQNSTDSFPTSKGLPRNSESFVLSRDAQRSLSGFQFLAIGLPPASPCSSEISPIDNFTTLFLIAAYGRYKSPYVWVRSNHERLIKLSDCNPSEQSVIKDSPLKLRTVTDWSTKDIKIWDIVAEVVRINVQPSPRNPFAVDHTYFDTLCLEECIMATGAMVYLLQKVLDREHSYNSLVSADLHEVTKRHFTELQTLACKPSRGISSKQSSSSSVEYQNMTSLDGSYNRSNYSDQTNRGHSKDTVYYR